MTRFALIFRLAKPSGERGLEASGRHMEDAGRVPLHGSLPDQSRVCDSMKYALVESEVHVWPFASVLLMVQGSSSDTELRSVPASSGFPSQHSAPGARRALTYGIRGSGGHFVLAIELPRPSLAALLCSLRMSRSTSSSWAACKIDKLRGILFKETQGSL